MRKLAIVFGLFLMYGCQEHYHRLGLEAYDKRDRKQIRKETESYMQYEKNQEPEENIDCPDITGKDLKKKQSKKNISI